MKNKIFYFVLSAALLLFVFAQFNCSSGEKVMTKKELIQRGKFLVNIGGCNDCHSPKVMTAMGPVPDTTKLLSGHPFNEPIAPIDMDMVKPGQWVLAGGMDFTSWVGPWGISFSRNLTPDSTTGIGAWTADDFINTIRNGKHLGTGRNLLPPMPWQSMAHLSNKDLTAIFTYLKSLPPIHNQVPNPVPPNLIAQYSKK